MVVLVVIGWPRGAWGDFSWEESRLLHEKIWFSDEKAAITSPGNLDSRSRWWRSRSRLRLQVLLPLKSSFRARAYESRARVFCWQTFCLSKVLSRARVYEYRAHVFWSNCFWHSDLLVAPAYMNIAPAYMNVALATLARARADGRCAREFFLQIFWLSFLIVALALVNVALATWAFFFVETCFVARGLD